MEGYSVVKKIGSGAQGECYLAINKEKGNKYAVKRIPCHRGSKGIREALAEAAMLKAFSPHPNVIQHVDSLYDEQTSALYIILEFADGGDLSKEVERRQEILSGLQSNCSTPNQGPPVQSFQPCTQDSAALLSAYFSEEHVLLIFTQIALGLYHIHRQSILHRDVKLQNVFLTSSGLTKLGDFGISKQLSNESRAATTYIGSPNYMSPEMHKRLPYDEKSDVWALGCLLYELCSLKKPFIGYSLAHIAISVIAEADKKLEVPDGLYPREIHLLVRKMLSPDPATRPTVSQILKLPYIMSAMKKLQLRYPHLSHFSSAIQELSDLSTEKTFSLDEAAELPAPENCSSAVKLLRNETLLCDALEKESFIIPSFASVEELLPDFGSAAGTPSAGQSTRSQEPSSRYIVDDDLFSTPATIPWDDFKNFISTAASGVLTGDREQMNSEAGDTFENWCTPVAAASNSESSWNFSADSSNSACNSMTNESKFIQADSDQGKNGIVNGQFPTYVHTDLDNSVSAATQSAYVSPTSTRSSHPFERKPLPNAVGSYKDENELRKASSQPLVLHSEDIIAPPNDHAPEPVLSLSIVFNGSTKVSNGDAHSDVRNEVQGTEFAIDFDFSIDF